MVLLLNLLFPLTMVLLGASYFKWKKNWIISVMAIALILYSMVQPSYMPKGKVERTELLPFEHKELEVQDRLLSSTSGQEMDERRNQMIQDGLPFKDPTQ